LSLKLKPNPIQMKKIYTLLLAGTMGGSLFAQQVQTAAQHPCSASMSLTPAQLAQLEAARAHKINELHTKSMNSSTVYGWYSPHDAITKGTFAGNFTTYVSPLFTDSTVTSTFAPSPASNVFLMKAGGVFDGTSTLYPAQSSNPVPTILGSQPYTIDTIWVAGYYNIKQATAGDTLSVEISFGPKASTWYQGLQISTATPPESWNMPLNTTSLMPGDRSFATAPAANRMIIKHVLSVTDTISVGNPNYPYIAIPVNLNIPGTSNIVGVQYTFSEKSVYTANQSYYVSGTNTSTMNSYLALLDQQTGLTSSNGMNYFYDASSDGTSGELDTKSRYGLWPAAQSFLNGCMLPDPNSGYIWALAISYTPTGINELNQNGLTLSQNSPNPFGVTSTVNYSLDKESDVIFTVYDLTGRIVSQNNFGGMNAGSHSINLNAADYGKGVYFYNIKTNSASLSKRMVITE
jgi:hypothetical protein